MANTTAHSSKSRAISRKKTLPQNTGTVSFDTPQQSFGFPVIEETRQGIPTQRVDHLVNLLNISLKEIAGILHLADGTLRRFRQEGRLNHQSSERLILLENLTANGLDVFDNRTDVFANWLRYPLRELKQQEPISLLDTISGFEMVDDVLTRIEYGVYS